MKTEQFEAEQRILSTIEIPMLPLLRHFTAVATRIERKAKQRWKRARR